jgi:hypothetical protein
MMKSPHISQPYVGKYFTRGQTLVNVVVPVKRGADSAGLLMGNVEWDDFQRWLTDVPFAGGFAVIANGLGQCLCHQDSEVVRPKPGEPSPRFYGRAEIPRDRAAPLPDFVDPVTGRSYLAASAPFQPLRDRDERWVVLIQHDPAAALAPVTELQTRLRRVGLWCLAIMALLIGGMWGGLIWVLRREERLAHG